MFAAGIKRVRDSFGGREAVNAGFFGQEQSNMLAFCEQFFCFCEFRIHIVPFVAQSECGVNFSGENLSARWYLIFSTI